MMTDPGRVAALLEEAAETHHRVYRITDGVDADWASWYADWLLRLSELPTLLGATPVRSELVYALVVPNACPLASSCTVASYTTAVTPSAARFCMKVDQFESLKVPTYHP